MAFHPRAFLRRVPVVSWFIRPPRGPRGYQPPSPAKAWITRRTNKTKRSIRLKKRAVLTYLPWMHRPPVYDKPVGDWRLARPGIAVPDAMTYHDIPMVPAREFFHRFLVYDGGPVWPDFDTNPGLWQVAHTKHIDRNAQEWRWRGRRLDQPVIWGGRAFVHFGHLVSEHVSRLPPALYRYPNAPVYFTLQPNRFGSEMPGYFWDVMAWLGLDPKRIRFVPISFG